MGQQAATATRGHGLRGELAEHGYQFVEVLPADDYEWAHLTGAVNHPLKELGTRMGQLGRSRPVTVY